MPAISAFYGILIRMFLNDHAPPHFHARYGRIRGNDIDTLEVLEGKLPPRALILAQEWEDDTQRGTALELAALLREDRPCSC